MEEVEVYKYVCEQCRYKSNDIHRWNKHLTTELHKTGKRKVRCDFHGPYNCEECDYKTLNATTFKQHKLNEHSNKEKRETEFKFYCKVCDFGSFSKQLFEKHLTTDKHKIHEKYYK